MERTRQVLAALEEAIGERTLLSRLERLLRAAAKEANEQRPAKRSKRGSSKPRN